MKTNLYIPSVLNTTILSMLEIEYIENGKTGYPQKGSRANRIYSQTYLKGLPKGRTKSGCLKKTLILHQELNHRP